MDGGPVITVQLFDRKTAVQQFRQKLCVSLASTAMQREVVHPLAISLKTGNAKKDGHYAELNFCITL